MVDNRGLRRDWGRLLNDMTVQHPLSMGVAPFFGENIRVCHGFPAQNRFIGASPPHLRPLLQQEEEGVREAGPGGLRVPRPEQVSGRQGILRARDRAREAAARGRGPVDRIERYIRRGPDAGTK